MNAHEFTTDRNTGYLDIPLGMTQCEGDCEEVLADNELTEVDGKMLCPECLPKCRDRNCANKAHPQSDGFCAPCELAFWESEVALAIAKSDPVTLLEARANASLWKGRV